MNRRGLSLLELMISIVIISVTMGAVARAFTLGLSFEATSERTTEENSRRTVFEDRVRALVEGAAISGTNNCFIAPIPPSTAGLHQTPPDTDSPADSELTTGATSLVCTTYGAHASYRFLNADGDFESLNEKYGPNAGAEEAAFSTVPVGDAGGRRGLFLRTQCPPDADPASGGEERLLVDKLREIRFEFYDGAQWQPAWDTTNGQKGLLPAAVRVSYVLDGDKTPSMFIVDLPLSNPGASTNSSAPNTTPPTTPTTPPAAPTTPPTTGAQP